jgi:uncharacterized protein (TIGR00106 family)
MRTEHQEVYFTASLYILLTVTSEVTVESKNVIAEISVVPLGTGNPGVSQYVAGCLAILSKYKNIKYRLTPMGTVLEGTLNDVLLAAKDMHNSPFNEGALRVVTTLKIDDRRDKPLSMLGKIESVKNRLPSVKT